jgi:hypothetical protein
MNKTFQNITLVLMLTFSCLRSTGQETGFIENKGQIIDQNGNANHEVLYLLHQRGVNIQVKNNGFSYDCYRLQQSVSGISDRHQKFMEHESSAFHFNRIDVTFERTNANAEVVPFGSHSDVLNYYMPDKEYLNVHKFSGVKFSNIYDKIDLEYYLINDVQFKYQFIVHEGGDISDISFRINGVESSYISGDQIVLRFHNDSIIEHIPVSYEIESGKKVDVRYNRKGIDVYGFSILEPVKKTLVIDPQPGISWATYYGGTAWEWLWSVTELNGYVYAVGETQSSNNIATAGAFQTTLVQATDAFITKLDGNGQRIWGTYFGGTVGDGFFSVESDSTGLYMCGYAEGSGLATPGAFDQTFAGGLHDGMIAHFDTSGARVWSTYYGGTSDDLLYDLHLTGPFLYVTGSVESSLEFATAGCHQATWGGNEDGCLSKFTTAGARVWGTYYGGTSTDNGYAITSNGNNIALVGYTYSNNAMTTPGAFQTGIWGGSGYDAYLAMFDTNGVRQWSTYYGGSWGEAGQDVSIYQGYVYMAGGTDSYSNIATPGAFQTTNVGGANSGYLVKFSLSGQRIWCTFYGGNSQEEIFSMQEYGGSLYLAGYTNSTTVIANPNAFQPVFGGTQDGFVVKFDTSGTPVWSTYFGGSATEYIHDIHVDQNVLLVGGLTQSTNNIATLNVHQNTLGGGFDGFVAALLDACLSFTATLSSTSDPGNCTGSVLTIPSGGTSPYLITWSSGDTTASVGNLCSGWYVCTIVDSNQCVYSDSVLVNSSTSIVQNNNHNQFTIYPSPAGDLLTVEAGQLNGIATYSIRDMLGNNVKSGTLISGENKLDVSALATGVYSMQISKSNNVVSMTFVIAK